jgi:serine/threonine protein kinase/Tfp pilus assembly protein PilF
MIELREEFKGSGVDPFVDAYELAQAREGPVDLAAFLPDPGHPLYPAVLCELVRIDLEFHWTRGRPVPLETYLSRFPALVHAPDLLRQAAFEEYRLRRQAGESPTADEYRSRFGLDELSWISPRPGLPDQGRLEAEPQRPVDKVSERRNGQVRRQDGDGPMPRPDAPGSPGRLPEPGELFRTLMEADVGTANRVAEALRRLPETGTEFAGFRLIRELGRGAFGRVYLARQGDLADRPVALKVSADLLGEPQALAQLQHTHIVPIYSTHRVGRLRAVCMPYFGATTLGDVLHDLRSRTTPPDSGAALAATLTNRRIDPGPAPARQPAHPTPSLQALRGLGYVQAVLWIGARLADGLAHAHERGIVHRDLKPANILLTDDGQPMLLDFNLAADTKSPCTAAAALVGGTLPYMAPEALEALRTGPQPADPRIDVYALGLILFELLTGRHPFPIRHGPVDEVLPVMATDRRGTPPSIRPSNPAVSPATAAVITRCLEPDPARRYQEARQLLEDLQRQLEDRPLRHAREPSPRERLRKWRRRHPRLSLSVPLVVVAALAIAGYVHLQRQLGPKAAELAYRKLADAHETARVLLLDPTDDPALRQQGLEVCRGALGPYGAFDSPGWMHSPLVSNLPAASRAELRAQIGEFLLLGARALARQAPGQVPAKRAELVREALKWNNIARSSYEPGEAPRVVWTQHAALAELAGDDAEAARSRRLADATPVRSLREHALLFLDDPGRAADSVTLQALAEASRQAPQDFALWMNLGQCQALLGRLAEAEDCFTVAAVLRPQSPWPFFHRGRVELERRDFGHARRDFDEVLRLRRGLGAAHVNRALALLGERDNAGAVAELTTALDLGVAATRVYFIRAEARARSGDRDGAARDRAEGLRRTPTDVESWVARGLARLPDDPNGALADFESALGLDPLSRSALQNKAVVLSERLGRTSEAVAALDRAVALYPDYVPARVGRGVLLARLGRRAAAHRDAEESRRRDPSGDTAYRVACIYALTAKGDPADRPRALRMLATALGQEPAWAQIAVTDPDLEPIHDQAGFADLIRTFSDPSGHTG